MNDDTADRERAERTAEAICEAMSLAGPITRFATGSVPVYAVADGYVLKLFPSNEQAFFETEKSALTRIDGSLAIPTPRLVAAGEHEAWWYVVMTRLHGVSLAEAWPTIPADARAQLMRDVGIGIAALHALPSTDMPSLALDWPAFLDAQRSSARERQRIKGLASPWIELIDPFLTTWMPADDGRRALLHTEIMREHLLVERHDDDWRLSGLVDFEPAMVGAPDYDFASIGVFVACGAPGLLRALLDAYGAKVDETLPYRIMAYALLHRYSHLRWYIERLGVGDARDLESLARRWFAVSG